MDRCELANGSHNLYSAWPSFWAWIRSVICLIPPSGPTFNASISVLVNASFILGAQVSGGGATIQFVGMPGTLYSIIASTDLIELERNRLRHRRSGPGTFQFQGRQRRPLSSPLLSDPGAIAPCIMLESPLLPDRGTPVRFP